MSVFTLFHLNDLIKMKQGRGGQWSVAESDSDGSCVALPEGMYVSMDADGPVMRH